MADAGALSDLDKGGARLGDVMGEARLLTHFGAYLCREPSTGRLVQQAAGERADRGLVPVRLRDLAFDALEAVAQDAEGGPFRVLRGRPGLLVAEPDGSTRMTDAGEGGRERFLLISDADDRDLRWLLAHRWLTFIGGSVQGPTVPTLEAGFKLGIAGRLIDLPDNLPFALADRLDHRASAQTTAASQGRMRRLTLFDEGWKVVECFLYKPLVYYVCYGEAWFKMLQTSLVSLSRLGRYDGGVLIITDKSTEYVHPFTPLELRDRVIAWNLPASGYVDFCAVRYQIPFWPGVEAYQPVLYVDTDVAFDCDSGPMLMDVLTSDKLSAQAESFSPLKSTWSVGSSLLEEDGCDPGDAVGFCAGIISIPSGGGESA